MFPAGTQEDVPVTSDRNRKPLAVTPVAEVLSLHLARQYARFMTTNPEDLEPIAIALLGVLCVGLPPSRAAGDDNFRVDHVTAEVASLLGTGVRGANLQPGSGSVTPAFRDSLRAAIDGLAALGIVAEQPAGMPAATGSFEAGLAIDMVNPDQHPAVLDRYLAQQCMEALFNAPAVYPYLMERYAKSGEVWRRLREGGYARD